MSKLNFFKPDSRWYPLRWYIVCLMVIVVLMVYMDTTGGKLLRSGSGQRWQSSGPGFHK